MTNPMLKAAARALREQSPFDNDAHDYSQEVGIVITAIEPMIRADERAQVEREIVEWLRGLCMHLSDVYADAIEAGEHRSG